MYGTSSSLILYYIIFIYIYIYIYIYNVCIFRCVRSCVRVYHANMRIFVIYMYRSILAHRKSQTHIAATAAYREKLRTQGKKTTSASCATHGAGTVVYQSAVDRNKGRRELVTRWKALAYTIHGNQSFAEYERLMTFLRDVGADIGAN